MCNSNCAQWKKRIVTVFSPPLTVGQLSADTRLTLLPTGGKIRDLANHFVSQQVKLVSEALVDTVFTFYMTVNVRQEGQLLLRLSF